MKKLLLLITIFAVSIMLHSCGAMIKGAALRNLTVENNAMPSNFGKDKATLICVLKGRESRDKYMRKHFKNEYYGKKVFILESKLNSAKYSDKNKYRYVIDYNSGSLSETTFYSSGGSNTMTAGTSNYFIYDRVEEKTYNSTAQSSAFSKLIQAYAINLEKIRKQNK